MLIRVPTNCEYDRLVRVTDGNDAKMHWEEMYTLVNDTENEYPLNPECCLIRGFDAADCFDHNGVADRYWDVGFRPAYDILDADTQACSLVEGTPRVIGTLYMDGEPVLMPKNPNPDGDVTQYKPGAVLEMREAMDDPAYQVVGIRVGNVVVADRVLVNQISYEDIELALRPKLEGTEATTLGSTHDAAPNSTTVSRFISRDEACAEGCVETCLEGNMPKDVAPPDPEPLPDGHRGWIACSEDGTPLPGASVHRQLFTAWYDMYIIFRKTLARNAPGLASVMRKPHEMYPSMCWSSETREDRILAHIGPTSAAIWIGMGDGKMCRWQIKPTPGKDPRNERDEA